MFASGLDSGLALGDLMTLRATICIRCKATPVSGSLTVRTSADIRLVSRMTELDVMVGNSMTVLTMIHALKHLLVSSYC